MSAYMHDLVGGMGLQLCIAYMYAVAAPVCLVIVLNRVCCLSPCLVTFLSFCISVSV